MNNCLFFFFFFTVLWRLKQEGQRKHVLFLCLECTCSHACWRRLYLSSWAILLRGERFGFELNQKKKVYKSFYKTAVQWSCGSQDYLGTVLFDWWKKNGSKCPHPLEILWEGYAGKVRQAAYSIEKAKLLCRDFFAADISCQSICAEMEKLQSQKETFIWERR